MGSLLQMRQDTKADYRIVATAWLSHREAVREELSVADDAVFELKSLDRDTMVQIVKDCGVLGPDFLISQMVTQAAGILIVLFLLALFEAGHGSMLR